ncbi:TIGR03545 family protein [Thalassotalea agarivorans]|uniref:TIGR03545 family protein n=1 Tax=Thalassotalea agarivorans TaxID=349064 RepID=A0A1H9Y1L9_THASX|nr:TIGR03545 family protein [Thalassotalea agarivorans]SES62159.1 TIGR03545 family protein [Thalassotalea agarivorans]
MKRFIRWQGLIGFLVFLALLLAFVYLIAESAVKRGIEYGVGLYTGAEVNVEAVEITYSPLSLTVIQFQATDKERPEYNLVSFNRATASLDFWQYLFGKTVIREMALEELAFGEKRTRAGEVFVASDADDDASFKDQMKAVMPSVDISLPNVDDLMADAGLRSYQSAEAFKQVYEQEKAALASLKDDLPDKAVLEQYQQKVKALSKRKVKTVDDVNAIKTEFDALKAQFEADKAKVEAAKTQLANSKKVLAQAAKDVKDAPGQDWQLIKEKYQLDKIDTADFAHILFGAQARQYYAYLKKGMDAIAPFLSAGEDNQEQVQKKRSQGRFVYFKEENPMPSFLIEQLTLSVKTPQGFMTGSGEELTHQHWIRNKPSAIKLASDDLMGEGKADFSARYKSLESGEYEADSDWHYENIKLTDKVLQDSDKFSLTLTQGAMQGNGELALINGELKAKTTANLTDVNFAGGNSSSINGSVVDTLNDAQQFSLVVVASGPWQKPSFSITSPLNNLLSKVLQKQVSDKVASFQNKVQAGLNEKIAGATNLNAQAGQEIVSLDKLLNNTDQALNDLMSSDVVKAQKKQLEDKAKNKIKEKLGDLFN